MSQASLVRMKGLRRTLRALEAAGASAEDMRDLMHALGMIVVDRARQRAPVRSGALSQSIRAGRGKTKAVVRAGFDSQRLPYAAVIHYGWPKRNIRANPYLTTALEESQQEVLAAFTEGIDQLLKDSDLK